MIYEIFGVKPVQGVSKKTGRPFDAYILHCAVENQRDKDLAGAEVKQIFADKSFLLEDVKRLGSYSALVGAMVSVDYDSNGFLLNCSIIPESDK